MATEDMLAPDEGSAATTAAQTPVETEVKTADQEEVAGQTEENPENQDENKPSEDDQELDEPQRRNRSGSEKQKARIARLEAELAQMRTQHKPAGEDIDARVRARLGEPPKEADFNGDYIAFSEASTAYKAASYVERANVSREIEREQREAEYTLREAESEHYERMRDAAKRIPDFKQVVESAAQLQLSDAVLPLIRESEKGPEIMYQIGKNPKLAEALNDPNPIKAAAALGRLEAKLTTPQPKKATEAPPPSAAVRGGAAPSSTWSGFEAWERKTYPHKYK